MKRRHWVIAALFVQGAGPALAAEWERTASVAPSITWTDNICLDNNDKRSDTIAAITPSLAANGIGARAFVRVNGSVTVSDVRRKTEDCARLGGALGGQADTVVPRLALNAGSELLRNLLFIEGDARVSQNLINAGFIGNDDSLNRAGNTNTSQSYRVSPYLQSRLGGVADLELRYAYDEQINSSDFVPDSRSETVAGVLAQDPERSRLSLGVRGSYNETRFDPFPGDAVQQSFISELGSAEVFGALRVARSWQLTTAVGREWNDFLSVDDDIDGKRWDVGAIWEPHARITVDGGYGRRFFGAAPRLDVRYRHLRSELRLVWSRDVAFNRDLRRGFSGFDDDNAGIVVDPITGAPLGPIARPTTLAQSPIINESVRLNYSLRGLRTTLSADGSFSEQRRTEDGAENTFFNAGTGLSRELSANSTLDFRVSWLKVKGDTDDGVSLFGFDSEEWRYSLAWNRTLSNRSRLTLLYQYTDRDSDEALFNFTENRVVLSLTLDL